MVSAKALLSYTDCMRISHIGVHKVYYETRDLFPSTKSQIYDKEKRNKVKVVML